MIEYQHFYLYRSRSSMAASQEKIAAQNITRSSIEITEDSTVNTISRSSNNCVRGSSANIVESSDDDINPLHDELSASPISDKQSTVTLNDSENNVSDCENVNTTVQKKTAANIAIKSNVIQKKKYPHQIDLQ